MWPKQVETNHRLLLALLFVFPSDPTIASFNRREADLTSNMIKTDHCTCPSISASGPPGIPGVPGLHGSRGQDGNKGDKGEIGAKGDLGPTGPSGPIGPGGTVGERGKKGPLGYKGESGVQGPKGDKGERGYTGFAGMKGSKGEPWEDRRPRVAFSVTRSHKLGPVTQDTPIAFDVILSNIGESFEQYSSHFVCRVNGTYFFTSHLVGQETHDLHVWIMLNDKHKTPLQGDKRCGTGSQSVFFQLKSGDHVWMELSKNSALLNDISTFSGFLLYED